MHARLQLNILQQDFRYFGLRLSLALCINFSRHFYHARQKISQPTES